MQAPAVTVLVVDDHPALRAGLKQLLDQEPGYRLLGAVSTEAELALAVRRDRADVVVLDYALARGVPATLAQADAIVSKNAPVDVLLSAIDAVAAGEPEVPMPDVEAIEGASSRLLLEDLPILGMLFARMRVAEIAATLGVEPREVRSRALRIIGEMQAQDRRHGHAAV